MDTSEVLYTIKEIILPNLRHHACGGVMGFGIREVPSKQSIRDTLKPYFKDIEFKITNL